MGKKDKKSGDKKESAKKNVDIYSGQNSFIDKLGAAGVSQQNLILIRSRLNYERATAELEAAKAYCEAQGFMNLNGKIDVNDMVSLIVRRCQGLQIAIEGIATELGAANSAYLGLSQLVWDITTLAERVEAIMCANGRVEYAKKIAIA